MQYIGLRAGQLLDEGLNDSKPDIREKRDIVLQRILGFYNYLVKDYGVRSRGNGNTGF